ncbi:hypothetical protein JCM10908_004248 [Rhodotorula pacifica]|uniref:WD40 repeat domain-containing protein n=1 Tax=Rhodotorula pacifica TaxID=1495444 RepID=UPI00317BE4B4
MADLNLPPHSFFAAPEGKSIRFQLGVYTLVSSLSGAPTNPTSVGIGTQTNQAANATSGTAPSGQAQTAEQQPPPPAYPSKTAVVAVTLPTKESGSGGQGLAGLGMGMSIGGRRGKDSDAVNTANGAAANGDSQADRDGNGGALGTQGGNAGSGAIAIGGGNNSPASKRKPLTSSFSMLGGLSLAAAGGDSNGGVTTSRPARTFKGSTSSFIRSWEGLPISQVLLRTIAEANAGRQTIFGFQTLGKVLLWHEIGMGKKEPLSRIVFASFPTCIDANQHTASGTQIDVLVGFVTGDILWMDPLTARYSRFNKSGCITSSPVTSILWLPPSPTTDPASPSIDPSANSSSQSRSNLFVTSHADGSVVLWDKDKEDWNGFVTQPFPPVAPSSHGASGHGRGNDWSHAAANGHTGASWTQKLEPHEGMVVSKPPATDRKGQSMAKYNPVSHWRLSDKAITSLAFSPDLTLCAAAGEDGRLRIIDAVEEQVLDVFTSYFGAINCVAWSPDGRFVVTGGQDDLVTVYAPLEQHIVAHCQGHSSWVTGVAWDASRSEERTLRIASVGEDCKLILWDLSSASLTRPKAHAHPHVRRHSVTSQASLSRKPTSDNGHDVQDTAVERPAGPNFHPAPRRDDVSLLQPAMVKTLSNDLFTGVAFLPSYVILSTRGGHVKQFDRPPDSEASVGGLSSEFAASVVRLDARAR